jgi:hypothetical protein
MRERNRKNRDGCNRKREERGKQEEVKYSKREREISTEEMHQQ